MEAPGFWDNPVKGAPLLQERRGLDRKLTTLKQLRTDASDLDTWSELIAEGEADAELTTFLDRLTQDLEKLEIELKLAGPDDEKSAILVIHPGAGGTESQDWA
ncbi:MAG TPA: PCRF domain-containing protein, partial [Thermoanaerobaculia bacterium]|nr:PCRF domain-containing protein [Thermoanaerobaculia bacterium]